MEGGRVIELVQHEDTVNLINVNKCHMYSSLVRKLPTNSLHDICGCYTMTDY